MGDPATIVTQAMRQLSSVSIQEFGLLWGFNDSVRSLHDDFNQIVAVLEDAEEEHNRDNAGDLRLKNLRSVSLEVENVLDEISTRALLQRLHEERGTFRCWTMVSTEVLLQHLDDEERGIFRCWNTVSAFFTSNQLVFRLMIAHKVKEIKTKLDAIAFKRFELTFKASGANNDWGYQGKMRNRETSSHICSKINIFGRHEEVNMVTEKICYNNMGKYENGEILVYGIWGMGGVGKTTLAQLVYNNERVDYRFGRLKFWIYVSQNFEVTEIIKKIITSIDGFECTLTSLNELQKSFRNKLWGKRFLIVLDDVWIEYNEKNKWDKLSKILRCGARGSLVLVTTRSQTTSQMMAKVPELQHQLGCLSEEDAWLLFKDLSFAQGRLGADISDLQLIGRKIAERCGGLPLAVNTLVNLMWSKKSKEGWENVSGNNVLNLEESYAVLVSLKLSYDDLLPHLKRCFAYCCLLPKSSEFGKNVLIPLWLSNGFIPPSEGRSPYYLGEKIFNCLVQRSFFQVVNVRAEIYKIHNLMYDMTRHVMGDDCLVIQPDKEIIIPKEVLHLTSSNTSFLCSPQVPYTSLRSIIMLGKIDTCISQIFNHMYIRVLYLIGMKLRTLPTSICKLKHLRYLNLSKSDLEVLPESIIYLQNLQVLLLSDCRELCKLPEGLRYMTNLLHLDINDCYLLPHLPSGIKKLTSLRVLSSFPIGNKSGAKIGELEDLNLLEGQLDIKGLENVGGLSEAKSANLKSKTNLSRLVLMWSLRESSQHEMFGYDEEVLKGLEPNLGLKELFVFGYMGKTISPSWTLKLSNMVKITLSYCLNCKSIPTLGRLPNLRVIKMWGLESLKCFHDVDDNMLEDTANAFLSLKKLHINGSSSLVSLPCNLPKLEVLKISLCGELVSLPGNLPNIRKNAFLSLKKLHINGSSSLVSLPCKLPKLEVLKISLCGELVSLPGNLPNIRKMWLYRCDRLLSLPNDIPSFEDLNELEISYCDHLYNRYNERTGKDWPKVAHIPKFSLA